MDNDPYGFCYHLQKDVVKVFNRDHLTAFVKQVRARFNDAAQANAVDGDTVSHRAEYHCRRWSDALRTLHVAQNDVTSYIAHRVERRWMCDSTAAGEWYELVGRSSTPLGRYPAMCQGP